MRLCIVSPFPPKISGVGQYGWHIATGLARTQHFQAVAVLAEHDPTLAGSLPPNALTVQRIWQRDDWRSPVLLMRAIARQRPDVVWMNAGMTMFGQSRVLNFFGLLIPLWARQCGLPVVTTLHEVVEAARLKTLGLQNGRVTHWGAQVATRALLASDAVCVTLRHYAHTLQTHYGARNVYHLPHGAFTPVQHLLHPDDAPPLDLLLFTSLAPHRGLRILLEAFDAVRQHFPAATLSIAGGDHPRFPGYAEQFRTKYGGQVGLRWFGPQTEAELQQRFAEARVVVLPYLATSGSSSVIYRAAALGRPIVASDLPDVRLSAEEADLCVNYVPPGDPSALARQLCALLTHPEVGDAQARHNLRVMHSLTLDETVEQYVALFQRFGAHA